MKYSIPLALFAAVRTFADGMCGNLVAEVTVLTGSTSKVKFVARVYWWEPNKTETAGTPRNLFTLFLLITALLRKVCSTIDSCAIAATSLINERNIRWFCQIVRSFQLQRTKSRGYKHHALRRKLGFFVVNLQPAYSIFCIIPIVWWDFVIDLGPRAIKRLHKAMCPVIHFFVLLAW